MFPKILQLMEGYILTIWNSLESVLNFLKNSAEDSVFSRLCPFSLNAFPKILRHMEGYILTIWNRLESVLRLLKKIRRIPSKIPCFPENLVTGKISLRIRYYSYAGTFRPFRTISEVFEKSSAEYSAEGSVIPCFPESVSRVRVLLQFSSSEKQSIDC